MSASDVVKGAVEPVINTVDQTVTIGLDHAGPFAELGFAVVLLVIVISVHGWCVGSISKAFARRIATVTHSTREWRVTMLMGVTVALLAITHLAETLIWTAPIWWLGLIPVFRDAYYFVLEAYTTLGEGIIALPDAWRLIGPVIAISGLFTFSWTGSVLVYAVTETGRRRAIGAQSFAHRPAPPKVDGSSQNTDGTPPL